MLLRWEEVEAEEPGQETERDGPMCRFQGQQKQKVVALGFANLVAF